MRVGRTYITDEDTVFTITDESDYDELNGSIYMCEREDGHVFYLSDEDLDIMWINGEIDYYDPSL